MFIDAEKPRRPRASRPHTGTTEPAGQSCSWPGIAADRIAHPDCSGYQPARQPPITHSVSMRQKEDRRLLDNPYIRQVARAFFHVMTAPQPGVSYAAVTAGRLEEVGTVQREQARR